MKQRTKRALSYEKTELIFKARLRPLRDYGIAVLAAGLALLLQFVLIPLFGGDANISPFMLFFAAVLVLQCHFPNSRVSFDKCVD